MKLPIVLGFLSAMLANAGIITYTDRAAFLAALNPGYYEEPFTSLAAGGLGVPSLNFSGNGFSYSITASGTTLYGVTISGDRSISVDGDTGLPLTVGNLGGGVTAIGGYFYFEDGVGGIATAGFGHITAANGVDPNLVASIPAPTSLTTFFGVISTTPLTSLAFESDNGLIADFVNIDDLIVGTAAVPEPSSISFVLFGLGALAALRRR